MEARAAGDPIRRAYQTYKDDRPLSDTQARTLLAYMRRHYGILIRIHPVTINEDHVDNAVAVLWNLFGVEPWL